MNINTPDETIYLQHRDFGITPVHIIDRLHGSIPEVVMEKYKNKIKVEIARIKKHALTLPVKHQETYRKSTILALKAQYQEHLESQLHASNIGPYYLQNSQIAQLTIEAWKFQANARGLVVIAICVMSNHLHALVRGPDDGTIIEAGKVMHSVKSFSAREGNKILARTGNPFWEHKYFDRDVREKAFMTVLWYILNNPVKAGLVNSWKEWPHTYLNPDYLSLVD